jgi:hypothetical protein
VDYSPSVSTVRITTWPVGGPSAPVWPSDLEGLVPQPEQSRPAMVQEWSELDYMITCAGQGDQMLADYVDQLVAAGFTNTGRTQMEGGQMVSAVLEDDPFTVKLGLSATGGLTIQITDEAITYSD